MSTPTSRRARRRARTVVERVALILTAALGLVFARYAFISLDFSWTVWPLSLLLCGLAVFCWSITAALWRSRVTDTGSRAGQPDAAGDP